MKRTQIDTSFADQIIEDYPNLHFIAFNEDSVLAVGKFSHKAHFFYKVSEDMSFHFNMLCEVGARYQNWFEHNIKFPNYTLGTEETATDYYNTLIRY